MEEFLLLGQVPGTTFTITFGFWLLFAAWAILIALTWRAFSQLHRLNLYFTGFIVGFSIRRQLRHSRQAAL